MNELSGKTVALLQRLAHFYNPAEAGQLLVLFAEVFGRRLERAETDLYRVLRSHHVETADNDGSQGYIAPLDQRGDLDKIFALYLEALGGTSQLVKTNPRFTVRSFDPARLSQTLLSDTTPLVTYLHERFAPATWDLLRRYTAAYALFDSAEIKAGLVLELILGETALGAAVGAQIAQRAPAVHAQIMRYTGGPTIGTALAGAVATALNEVVLPDPNFFIKQYEALGTLELDPAIWPLIYSLYADWFRPHYDAEPQAERRNQLLALLDQSEPIPPPRGEAIVRLNRLLLDAAFGYDERKRPWGVRLRQIPMLAEVRQTLADELNRELDDPALFTIERFPELAEDAAELQTIYANDLVRLNRLALESAWTYEIEKSYTPYRERLQGLIAVLRRGASTRQGILDIVAANLGIVGRDPAVQAAKALIDIEEFLPQRAVFWSGNVGFYQEIAVDNTNLSAEAPQVAITMLRSAIRELANLQLVDLASGQRVLFPGRIQVGDRLTFEGSSVLRNGIVPAQALLGAVPHVAPGVARWRFTADVIGENGLPYPAAAFGKQNLDQSVFVPDEPVVAIEVASYALTYGVFTVTIPWHIPGFTDKFEESTDHPRQQILTLVNRVKAAGVQAIIAYKQSWTENHELLDRVNLVAKGPLLNTKHDLVDSFDVESRQRSSEDHHVSDALVLAGAFDYTSFDSLNTFA